MAVFKARKGQSGGGIKLPMNETIFMILAFFAAAILIYAAIKYGGGLTGVSLNIIRG